MRWLPWVLLPGLGILALGIIDLVLSRRRADHRSLAGLAAGADPITLRAGGGDHPHHGARPHRPPGEPVGVGARDPSGWIIAFRVACPMLTTLTSH